jgi:hypothetical protein
MGAANSNDNDFSDGDDMNNEDQFGAEFPHLGNNLNELESEEQKRDSADNDEFGDFHYDFENAEP